METIAIEAGKRIHQGRARGIPRAFAAVIVVGHASAREIAGTTAFRMMLMKTDFVAK